eukprot:scaffold130316_cov75-Phaeocystis_antarctica.AAC.1
MEAAAVAQVALARQGRCPKVAHTFGAPFLAIKDIANNELSPEPLQLEPEHTLAEECSGVKLGLAAAEVTVGVIQLCAAATPTVAPAYPVAAGLSSGGWIYSNPALLQGDHPVGVRPGSR